MEFVVYYLIFINLISFIIFGIDKDRAKKRKWRITERNLFLLAILLGSPGCILGMYAFRHKTKHLRFLIGMPVVLIVQLILFYFLQRI